MCIGVPMQVVEPGFAAFARCRTIDGEERDIDLVLVGPQQPGAWVLVFLDAAREVVSAEEAELIAKAHKALGLAMQGEASVDHLFPDLIDREPELPPHLRAALGQSEKST